MPLYEYKCGECGHADDEYMRMGTEPLLPCPVCGEQSYVRQVSRPHSTQKEYARPIEQYSIAMQSLDEIRDFKRKAPDVEVSEDTRNPMYGVPIVRSRHQKQQALKAAGFEERN